MAEVERVHETCGSYELSDSKATAGPRLELHHQSVRIDVYPITEDQLDSLSELGLGENVTLAPAVLAAGATLQGVLDGRSEPSRIWIPLVLALLFGALFWRTAAKRKSRVAKIKTSGGRRPHPKTSDPSARSAGGVAHESITDMDSFTHRSAGTAPDVPVRQ